MICPRCRHEYGNADCVLKDKPMGTCPFCDKTKGDKMKDIALKLMKDDPNVVAVWTGKDEVIVGTENFKPVKLPVDIRGLPVTWKVVGKIEALQSRKDKWRPAPGGVSIGHYDITAGTLGGIVKVGDIRVILSNNHVLANGNDASIGDEIFQPGPADINGGNGGPWPPACPWASAYTGIGNFCARVLRSRYIVEAYVPLQEDYIIATLDDFVPINFDQVTPNLVDCAIALPISDDLVLDEILEIGVPTGTRKAVLGMEVRKSGRTSGLNHGIVEGIDGVVRVSYGGGRYALFEDQIITSFMASGGDSGSWLIADDAIVRSPQIDIVGLLFAGSDKISIHNHIDNVFNELGVSL